ncbi:MAG: glycerol-3-phosphate 1-O-acyltransferase PlsY [Flavobacteriales bacterium]
MMGVLLLWLLAYLMGAIPSAVWLGKLFFGKDIREHGSNNAGATNTFRVFGKKLGIAVLLLDVGKGIVAMVLVNQLAPSFPSPYIDYPLIEVFAALCCVLGHIFPVFVQFRGGKGVATSLGILLGMNPWPTLVCLGVFILVFLTFKIVSLASMGAAISLPVISLLVFEQNRPLEIVFHLTIAALVVFAHRKNIVRLLNKEEPKMNFGNPKL